MTRRAYIAVALAPLAVFIIVLGAKPPVAGFIAGATLSRLTDPAVLIIAALSAAMGFGGRPWWWSIAAALLVSLVVVLMNYSYWNAISPSAAQEASMRWPFWAAGFAAYFWIAGTALRPSTK